MERGDLVRNEKKFKYAISTKDEYFRSNIKSNKFFMVTGRNYPFLFIFVLKISSAVEMMSGRRDIKRWGHDDFVRYLCFEE